MRVDQRTAGSASWENSSSLRKMADRLSTIWPRTWNASAGSSALPSASCQTGSVTGLCNYYTPAQLTLAKTNFGNCVNNGDATVDGAWCPLKRVNTLTGNGGTGPDFVGIYIRTVHPYVTKLFGNALYGVVGVVIMSCGSGFNRFSRA